MFYASVEFQKTLQQVKKFFFKFGFRPYEASFLMKTVTVTSDIALELRLNNWKFRNLIVCTELYKKMTNIIGFYKRRSTLKTIRMHKLKNYDKLFFLQ